MSGYGPPDDPSDAPTGYYDYGDDSAQGDAPPGTPWYRRPIISVLLGLLVAILLGLVIYLLTDLTHGKGGSTQTPTSPTSATEVTTTVNTPEPTTTEPAAPVPTTTPTTPPTTTEPTTTAPTTTAPSTSFDDGRRHHRHRDDGGMP